MSSKIALKHIADDEIINDLSERLRSRRQKRERDDSDEFDVTAEDFGDEMSRVMRKKRQWGQIGTGMTLPFGMSMDKLEKPIFIKSFFRSWTWT